MKTLHFKDKEGYRKFLAYGHIRNKSGGRASSPSKSVFATTRGNSKIYIHGQPHRVQHVDIKRLKEFSESMKKLRRT